MNVMSHDGVRHHLGKPIGLGIRHFQNSCHIAHGVFGHHFTESGDIGNALVAVFPSTVFDNFVATGVLDIGVDIWHGDTVGVQKTFEKKVIF